MVHVASVVVAIILALFQHVYSLSQIKDEQLSSAQVQGTRVNRMVIDRRNNFTICLTSGAFFGWNHLPGPIGPFSITSVSGLLALDYNYDMERVVVSGNGTFRIYSIIPGSTPTFSFVTQRTPMVGQVFSSVRWLVPTSYIIAGLTNGTLAKLDSNDLSVFSASRQVPIGNNITQIRLRKYQDSFIVGTYNAVQLNEINSLDFSNLTTYSAGSAIEVFANDWLYQNKVCVGSDSGSWIKIFNFNSTNQSVLFTDSVIGSFKGVEYVPLTRLMIVILDSSVSIRNADSPSVSSGDDEGTVYSHLSIAIYPTFNGSTIIFAAPRIDLRLKAFQHTITPLVSFAFIILTSAYSYLTILDRLRGCVHVCVHTIIRS